jgi:hypothetical protein
MASTSPCTRPWIGCDHQRAAPAASLRLRSRLTTGLSLGFASRPAPSPVKPEDCADDPHCTSPMDSVLMVQALSTILTAWQPDLPVVTLSIQILALRNHPKPALLVLWHDHAGGGLALVGKDGGTGRVPRAGGFRDEVGKGLCPPERLGDGTR